MQSAKVSYNKMFFSYLKTFKRLGLQAIPMAAETGPIGGDLSHEFIILADTGESKIYTDKNIFKIDVDNYKFEEKSLEKMVNDYSSIYAVTDDKFNKTEFDKKVIKNSQVVTKGYRSWTYFLFW